MITFTSRKDQFASGGVSAIFTLDNDSAKTLVKSLKGISKGSWEYNHVLSPVRSALRRKVDVTLYGEGFGISSIASLLSEHCGYEY